MVEAYYPKTLREALEIRKERPAIPYAGGTDLMVLKNHEGPFLFLGGVGELKGVRREGDRLVIGAAGTIAELLSEEMLPEVLRKAMQGIAAPAIRNLGTIGGNVCNASPAGAPLPVLYAMDAELVLESASKKETVRIEDFITGVKKTKLEGDQLLTQIVIPAGESAYSYKKIGARRALAISKLSFAGLHRVENGVIKEIAVAFGAVGPTVLRSREAEEKIKGKQIAEPDIEGILREYDGLIRPIDDQRSTALYRKRICLNLLREYLMLISINESL
jgi:CO/xanthine dehydrogenase FAD-binding subunit